MQKEHVNSGKNARAPQSQPSHAHSVALASRFGRARHALVIEKQSKELAYVARRIEMTGDTLRTPTD
jgi:hypothetical protein